MQNNGIFSVKKDDLQNMNIKEIVVIEKQINDDFVFCEEFNGFELSNLVRYDAEFNFIPEIESGELTSRKKSSRILFSKNGKEYDVSVQFEY